MTSLYKIVLFLIIQKKKISLKLLSFLLWKYADSLSVFTQKIFSLYVYNLVISKRNFVNVKVI